MKIKTVKQVKMHNFLVCASKSQDLGQSQNCFARSHDRETVTFRNSALMFSPINGYIVYFNTGSILNRLINITHNFNQQANSINKFKCNAIYGRPLNILMCADRVTKTNKLQNHSHSHGNSHSQSHSHSNASSHSHRPYHSKLHHYAQ